MQRARVTQQHQAIRTPHAHIGAAAPAFGRFERDEPDKCFRVLAGSQWRRPALDPTQTTYKRQVRVGELQDELIAAGDVGDAGKDDPIFDDGALAELGVTLDKHGKLPTSSFASRTATGLY